MDHDLIAPPDINQLHPIAELIENHRELSTREIELIGVDLKASGRTQPQVSAFKLDGLVESSDQNRFLGIVVALKRLYLSSSSSCR